MPALPIRASPGARCARRDAVARAALAPQRRDAFERASTLSVAGASCDCRHGDALQSASRRAAARRRGGDDRRCVASTPWPIDAVHEGAGAAAAARVLSAAQWARLDAGNGEPWLAVARRCARRATIGAGATTRCTASAAARIDDRAVRARRSTVAARRQSAAICRRTGPDASLRADRCSTVGCRCCGLQTHASDVRACGAREPQAGLRRGRGDAARDRSDSMLMRAVGAASASRRRLAERRVVAVGSPIVATVRRRLGTHASARVRHVRWLRGARATIARFGYGSAAVGEPQGAARWMRGRRQRRASRSRCVGREREARKRRDADRDVGSAAATAAAERGVGSPRLASRSAGVAQPRRDPVDRDVDAALHALDRRVVLAAARGSAASARPAGG